MIDILIVAGTVVAVPVAVCLGCWISDIERTRRALRERGIVWRWRDFLS